MTQSRIDTLGTVFVRFLLLPEWLFLYNTQQRKALHNVQFPSSMLLVHLRMRMMQASGEKGFVIRVTQ